MQQCQDRVPLDLSQLQRTMQRVELACNSIKMYINPKEAEAALFDLCQSSQTYQACQFILENSQVADAKFQAAAAIGSAGIKEWAFLTGVDKIRLINFCLGFVMQHGSLVDDYVQTKVSSTAAQLMKRGWLEFSMVQRETFFNVVKEAIFGDHGVYVQYSGVQFIDCLVTEFSPSCLRPMGLPGEYHEYCRMSIELEYLMKFYCWAESAAQSVANQIIKSEHPVAEFKVSVASLRLMHQILNWEFMCQRSATNGQNEIMVPTVRNCHSLVPRKLECVLVQPGPSWRDILVSGGHNEWLFDFYDQLREKYCSEVSWLDNPVSVAARELIVQLCSLTGSIFSLDGEQTQEHHLHHLISRIIRWIDQPDTVCSAIRGGASESELVDGCWALFYIANVTTPIVFDKILKDACPFGIFYLLATLMTEVVKDLLLVHDSNEERWSRLAHEILLDSWMVVLVNVDIHGASYHISPKALDAVAGLFTLIVEAELRATLVPSNINSVQSEMDEKLCGYAYIGRATIGTAIPLLSQLLSEGFSRLNQSRGISDALETLEDTCCLFFIAGHVLADEGDGEIPMVPHSIQDFGDIQCLDKHPVLLLVRSILSFVEKCLNPRIRESIFSPRLMEAVVWFLGRWSATYLMPAAGNTERESFLNFYGVDHHGKNTLDLVVRVAATALISYTGENDLQKLVCSHLLPSLTRRRDVCTHLVTLESWKKLAEEFCNGRILLRIHSVHQRMLARVLVSSASGMKDTEYSNGFVLRLMVHVTASLTDMSNSGDLRTVSQHPEFILMITCFYERLRGAASASDSRTVSAVFDMGFSVLKPTLIFLETYKDEPAVVHVLLQFIVEWFGSQISYMDAQQTTAVIDFSMCLLNLYASQHIGKIPVSTSSRLLSQAKDAEYKDLRAILQLLTKLCSRDMVDYSLVSMEELHGIKISEVVYFGLHIISPLISMDMLKYPKLCFDYFSLLSHLLEVYPEILLRVNPDTIAHLNERIGFGMGHQDVDILDMSLRALNSLASYHYKEVMAGGIGLHTFATDFIDSHGNLRQGILSANLRTLLHLLLFDDFSMEIVGCAADALLPLILCDHALYLRLGNELTEKAGSEDMRRRMANALHLLTSSNELLPKLDRPNYQKFRKNLSVFLLDVRGFLRTI